MRMLPWITISIGVLFCLWVIWLLMSWLLMRTAHHHGWSAWSGPQQVTYRDKKTLVQMRTCERPGCHKVQVRAL